MRQARVTVTDEDGTALGLDDVLGVFRTAGWKNLDVLSCEGVRGVVRVTVENEVDEERLEDIPTVVWYERVVSTGPETSYVVEFDASESEDAIAACHDELLHCGTIDVNDDGFVFDIAGPQDAISETIGEYQNAGANVTLEALQDYRAPDRPLDALTQRQQEVVEVAFTEGYFDVPRSASTDEVAAELDLDSSTVAEHLQRAERNLVSTVLAQPA